MTEILLLIGVILIFFGFAVGQWLGKTRGIEEGWARGKEEGYRLGVDAGQGAALALPKLSPGSYTVVDTITGKADATRVFLIVRLQRDDPLYDMRGEIITVALPKGNDPLPALPFLLTKDEQGGVTCSRLRAGSRAS